MSNSCWMCVYTTLFMAWTTNNEDWLCQILNPPYKTHSMLSIYEHCFLSHCQSYLHSIECLPMVYIQRMSTQRMTYWSLYSGPGSSSPSSSTSSTASSPSTSSPTAIKRMDTFSTLLKHSQALLKKHDEGRMLFFSFLLLKIEVREVFLQFFLI